MKCMCHWKFVKKKKCQISSENIQSDLTRNAIHLLLINARQTEWISLMNVKYVAGFCSKVLARPCMKIEHNLRNRYGISIMPITPNDQYINSCWLSMIIRNIFTVLRRPLNAVPWISVINIQCTHFISQQFTLMWLHTVHVVFIARQSLK